MGTIKELNGFQSSFELTSYITKRQSVLASALADVSKLFRAYELYNDFIWYFSISCRCVSKLFRAYELYNLFPRLKAMVGCEFQSSFELTSYITNKKEKKIWRILIVSKLFRAYELYNYTYSNYQQTYLMVSKLFRAYELYN